MLLSIINYIWDLIQKSPAAARPIALLRLVRMKARLTIRNRPYIGLLAILLIGFFVLLNPQYSPYLPTLKCGYINVEGSELYKEAGDRLTFEGDRPCEPNHVQALEFVNLSNVDLENNKHFVPAVSAGLFLKETARGVEMKDQWHEYTLFFRSNNFIWNSCKSSAGYQD